MNFNLLIRWILKQVQDDKLGSILFKEKPSKDKQITKLAMYKTDPIP